MPLAMLASHFLFWIMSLARSLTQGQLLNFFVVLIINFLYSFLSWISFYDPTHA